MHACLYACNGEGCNHLLPQRVDEEVEQREDDERRRARAHRALRRADGRRDRRRDERWVEIEGGKPP